MGSAKSRPEHPVPRMVIGAIDLPMANDLLLIVSLYTAPFATESLITLPGELAPLSVYSKQYWKKKTLIERRGLVFADDVVDAQAEFRHPEDSGYHGWYIYYRQSVRCARGRVSRISPKGVIENIFDQTDTYIVSGCPGSVLVHTPGSSRLFDTDGYIPIELKIPTNVTDVFKFRNEWFAITESGEMVDDKGKIIAHDVVECDQQYGMYLTRDGTLVGITHDGRSWPKTCYPRPIVWAATTCDISGSDYRGDGISLPRIVVLTRSVIGYWYIGLDGGLYLFSDGKSEIEKLPTRKELPLPAIALVNLTEHRDYSIGITLVDGSFYRYHVDTARFTKFDLPPIKHTFPLRGLRLIVH